MGLHGAAVAFVVWTTFWPWARSGRQWRDSYELFGVAERLGVTSPGVRDLLHVWVFVPAASAVGAIAWAFGRRRVAAALGTAVGVAAVVAAIAVAQRPLASGSGLVAALWGGVVVVITGAFVIAQVRKSDVHRADRLWGSPRAGARLSETAPGGAARLPARTKGDAHE